MTTPVLFLSYYFPPLGGAGVQRSAKFVRYLPELGFTPTVVAGPAEGRGRWEPTDQVLAGEIPAGIEVFRPGATPAGLGGSSRLTRLVGGLSPWSTWWQAALLATAREAACAHPPEVILATLSPFEGLTSALQLGDELERPVVADLRDPWALDEVQVYPTAWHRARERRRMGGQLARCAAVIMNTPEARRAALDAFGLDPARVHCITNGYDAEDFEGSRRERSDDRFRIVHTGYLHTARALAHARRSPMQRRFGGELCPVDFRGRSHLFLLQAIEALARRDADLAGKVELRLVGMTSPADREAARASAVANQVTELGYQDHHASVSELVNADLCFLPMHALPPGHRARIVPGKTYEYLASGRPILAAVPEGDARDFVVAAGGGDVVDPLDVEAIASALEARLRAAPEFPRDLSAQVTRFERRALTERLSEVLRQACAVTRSRNSKIA
ncbi:MAG: glycosyltransferase [Planctomycetota bacterium]|nr:glycosyltransferase [Planctomycetota bacterium]